MKQIKLQNKNYVFQLIDDWITFCARKVIYRKRKIVYYPRILITTNGDGFAQLLYTFSIALESILIVVAILNGSTRVRPRDVNKVYFST